MAERIYLDPSEPAGVNLVTNPTAAESATVGVNKVGGATTSARVVNSLGTPPGLGLDTYWSVTTAATAGRLNWEVALEAGKRYVFSCYVKVIAQTATDVRMIVRNSAGTALATGNIKTTVGTEWERWSVVFVATETAAHFFGPAQNGTGAAEWLMTAGQVEEVGAAVTAPTRYFDGSQTPALPTYTLSWTGTPNASTSARTPIRTEVDITPWVKAEPGVEWGDANVVPYKAQGERGEQVIDFKLENRAIGIPLALRSQGGTTFTQIRSTVQAVIARWMSEGGIIKRVTGAGGTVYADIPIAGMAQGGNFLQALERGDTEAELHLEAIPDFYEPEVELTSAEEKTLPELIKVIPDPGGDMPARVRIVVEEKSGVSQKGIIWGFRSRYYSSATTAKAAYEAEELELLGSSTKTALAEASGGTVVQNAALPSVYTPVLGIKPGGTAYPTHQGTYRMFARMRSVSGTAVAAQLVWDVGDLVNPTTNSAWRFPAGSAFFDADLGEVRLQAPPVGTYRWQGRIDAKGTEGGEAIQVDRVWLVNEDEGMGVLTSPPQPTIGTLTAWDNFNSTTSGTITGKVASLGGTWTAGGASGMDAVGFAVDTENHWIKREEKADSDLNTGYYARLGAGTAANVDASLDVFTQNALPLSQGLFVRLSGTESKNWLMACYQEPSGTGTKVVLKKRVAGTVTVLAESGRLPSARWRTLRLTVDGAGNIVVYDGPQGSSTQKLLTVTDSALASGGALETGGYGAYDAYTGASTVERKYDNFFLTVPSATADAVVYASQKAQLTTKGMFRLDSGGTAYGPVSRVIGDLPRLPAGGLENRSTELFVKASRGDFDQVADPAIDDIAVKVFASRSWLTVPGTI